MIVFKYKVIDSLMEEVHPMNYNLLGKTSIFLMVTSHFLGNWFSGLLFFGTLLFSVYKLEGKTV
jgi:hypothetical protein